MRELLCGCHQRRQVQRRLARHHPVGRRTEGVHVGGNAGRRTARVDGDLRRQRLERPTSGLRGRRAARDNAGKPEVADEAFALGVEEEVPGLHVVVEQPEVVCATEAPTRVLGPPDRVVDVEPAPG
jgi:hypothetical protein